MRTRSIFSQPSPVFPCSNSMPTSIQLESRSVVFAQRPFDLCVILTSFLLPGRCEVEARLVLNALAAIKSKRICLE